MRRAVTIDRVRAYLEQQLAAIEPGRQRPTARYVWLYWLRAKALTRAERAGVGAVLAADLDDRALEALGLLDEQLHWQGRIGRVPRDVTQDAVAPYWSSDTAISASAEGWHRRCRAQEIEP